ncbi:MAG TPA: GtrA family protein [Candidatus Cybelea sp.]|nr:GtrA family protein [Candidatus Cybelea sp.]
MPRRLIPRIPWQFVRFGVVGVLGFLVDAGLLRELLAAGLGYYGGRAISFLAAATTTWILNRSFTFRRDARPRTHPAAEWFAYVGLMLIGGGANYGVAALAYESVDLVRQHPEIAVALGSLAGMAINYWSAKIMIFERRSPS